VAGLNAVQSLSYAYDAVGNLSYRRDALRHLNETFGYDALDRLTCGELATAGSSNCNANSTAATVVAYDSFGNITSKTGVGTYDYGNGAGPHAVTAIVGAAPASYTYDANGNNQTGDGRTLRYAVFDKPVSISKGSVTTQFAYDPERAFYKRTDISAGQATTTVYMGNVEKVSWPDGSVETRRYVAGALVTSKYTAGAVQHSSTIQYLLKDHLGSIDQIVDQNGTVVSAGGGTLRQSQSFDVWGLRRSAVDWTAFTATALAGFDHSVTGKGFTGHEMLDEVGIIHMNGRIYDPKLGRFLQADPQIQFPDATQSYNRYSYLLNNPLNDIDPTGYGNFFGHTLGHLFDGLIHSAGSIIFAVACSVGTSGWGTVGCFAAAASWQTAVNGGSWQDILRAGAIAGASAWAFNAIGDQFSSLSAPAADSTHFFAGMHGTQSLYLTAGQFALKVAEAGLVGGIGAVLQGGKFGSGFAAAGVTAGLAPQLSKLGRPGVFSVSQLGASMVVGGTASAITGGKFANGAITAAFENLFNQQKLIADAKQNERLNYLKTQGVGANQISDAYLVLGDVISDPAAYKSMFPSIAGADVAHRQVFENQMYMLMTADMTVLASVEEVRNLASSVVDKGATRVLDDTYGQAGVYAYKAMQKFPVPSSPSGTQVIRSTDDLLKFYATETQYFQKSR